MQEGRHHSYAYYLLSSAVRSFYLKDGTEVNTWFAFEHEVVGVFRNYLGESSRKTLQLVEDSRLIAINLNTLKPLQHTDLAVSNFVLQIKLKKYSSGKAKGLSLGQVFDQLKEGQKWAGTKKAILQFNRKVQLFVIVKLSFQFYLKIMDTQQKYTPIDCNFYDRIEAAIVQRKTVRLEYWDAAEQAVSLATTLQDTLTRDSEEFVILPGGEKIRLDRIISLDGEPVPKSC